MSPRRPPRRRPPGRCSGLMAAGEVDHPAVARGIAYLQRTQDDDGLWRAGRTTPAAVSRASSICAITAIRNSSRSGRWRATAISSAAMSRRVRLRHVMILAVTGLQREAAHRRRSRRRGRRRRRRSCAAGSGARPARRQRRSGIISIGIAGALAPRLAGRRSGSWPTPCCRRRARCRPIRPGRAGWPPACRERGDGTRCSARTPWWRTRRKRPRCTARPAPSRSTWNRTSRRASRGGTVCPSPRCGSSPMPRTARLPPAALVGMKPDGGMDLPAVLRSLLANPGQLPALIRTGLEAERGFRGATPLPPPSWRRTWRPGSRPACCSTWREKTNSAGRWLSSEMSGAIAPSVRTPRSGDRQRLQRMPDHVRHGRCLEAAMDHAVGALLVVADAVLVPLGVFHQLLEGLGIAFAQQVAGLLPAEHGARRDCPTACSDRSGCRRGNPGT